MTKTRINWFCKHCQVEGSFEISATILLTGRELIVLIEKDHKEKGKIKGETWILLNIGNDDKVYTMENMIKIGSRISRPENFNPQFIILHIQ